MSDREYDTASVERKQYLIAIDSLRPPMLTVVEEYVNGLLNALDEERKVSAGALEALAYHDNCTLSYPVFWTDSGWHVDRSPDEFRRFFAAGGQAMGGSTSDPRPARYPIAASTEAVKEAEDAE